MPRKIVWSTLFDHTFDLSMAFDKFKWPQTTCLLMLSYLHRSEMHAPASDKLLRAFTAFK